MCLVGVARRRFQNSEPKRYFALSLRFSPSIMADRSTRFFTETASMRTLSLSSSAQGDRSFRIGLGVVILFAAAEIFSASYYYIGRVRTARTAPQPSVAAKAPTPAATLAPTAPPVAKASPS